jgi:peptide/nickel transport system substrate-binding protein
MKKIIQQGDELVIKIETENSDSILYFLTNNQGDKIASEIIKLREKDITINITSNNTKELGIGANSIKIFAVSNSVLKPDFIKSNFIVTDNKVELPVNTFENIQFSKNDSEYWIWFIPVIVIAGIMIYLKKKN